MGHRGWVLLGSQQGLAAVVEGRKGHLACGLALAPAQEV